MHSYCIRLDRPPEPIVLRYQPGAWTGMVPDLISVSDTSIIDLVVPGMKALGVVLPNKESVLFLLSILPEPDLTRSAANFGIEFALLSPSHDDILTPFSETLYLYKYNYEVRPR